MRIRMRIYDQFSTSVNITEIRCIFPRQRAPPRFSLTMRPRSPRQVFLKRRWRSLLSPSTSCLLLLLFRRAIREPNRKTVVYSRFTCDFRVNTLSKQLEATTSAYLLSPLRHNNAHCSPALTLYSPEVTVVPHRIMRSWYTGR